MTDRARPLAPRERETLEALLAADFPGAPELRAQLPGTLVSGGCTCGCPSVHLEPSAGAPLAAVVSRVPVEGTAADVDGAAEALVLLFVDDGRLSYLECAPLGERTPPEFPPAHRLVGVAPARDEPEPDD